MTEQPDCTAEYWCAFSRLVKTGSAFANRLYSHFGSMETAWHASKSDLLQVQGITSNQINNFVNERASISPKQSFDYIKSRNIDIIHPEDSRYPYILRFIDNPPCGLFMKGDITLCNLNRTLAAAGSRRASEGGKNVLAEILSGFKNTDICIVSGLAEGIDTIAHKTALKNGLKTIAVIGGGFDRLYPKSNAKLFDEIIDGNGAVLSEYWIDTDALSMHFPVRNRIISGISKGVFIAEAALRSGAMITARFALEQGRELMCMPGLISNPNTEGIYKLIKEGAHMITCTQDILDAMDWVILNKKEEQNTDECFYTEDEKLVLETIKKDILNIDKIAVKTGININDLMVILTKLELEGVISSVCGNKYVYSGGK